MALFMECKYQQNGAQIECENATDKLADFYWLLDDLTVSTKRGTDRKEGASEWPHFLSQQLSKSHPNRSQVVVV